MSKGIKCRSLLNSKLLNPVIEKKGSYENIFKVKKGKIKHGYLTKQLMYSFKSNVDTSMHSYLP